LEAIEKIEPPVQPMNTPAERKFLSVADLDWSDLKFLVEVGDAGSLREAARRQRVSVNTVRAHLAKLEQVAGEAVVNRGLSGAKLTKTGERLYHAAAALGRTPIDGADARDKGLIEPGTFTFGCTEGVGTSWLTPRVAALSNQIRPTTINMQFDYDLKRDRSCLVDLGLAYRPPADANLIVAKVATIHMMLFASPDYLRANGVPNTIDDLRNHIIVEQASPGYNDTAIDLLLGSDRPRSMTSIRTNSSLTQAYAAANGAGIALLPSYTRAITTTLVPLPVLPQMRVALYYFYRAEAKDCHVLREAIDWLRASFDSSQYPWFSDQFVHPEDFHKFQASSDGVVSLFAHMMDRMSPGVAQSR
jgi:DNA-binding transcriptional LysR family regulator